MTRVEKIVTFSGNGSDFIQVVLNFGWIPIFVIKGDFDISDHDAVSEFILNEYPNFSIDESTVFDLATSKIDLPLVDFEWDELD